MRVTVHASGVCYADTSTAEASQGQPANLSYSRPRNRGPYLGTTADTEEAMNFAQLNGVKPIVERMPLTAANEALSKIAAGQPGFRIVLDPQGA